MIFPKSFTTSWHPPILIFNKLKRYQFSSVPSCKTLLYLLGISFISLKHQISNAWNLPISRIYSSRANVVHSTSTLWKLTNITATESVTFGFIFCYVYMLKGSPFIWQTHVRTLGRWMLSRELRPAIVQLWEAKKEGLSCRISQCLRESPQWGPPQGQTLLAASYKREKEMAKTAGPISNRESRTSAEAPAVKSAWLEDPSSLVFLKAWKYNPFSAQLLKTMNHCILPQSYNKIHALPFCLVLLLQPTTAMMLAGYKSYTGMLFCLVDT